MLDPVDLERLGRALGESMRRPEVEEALQKELTRQLSWGECGVEEKLERLRTDINRAISTMHRLEQDFAEHGHGHGAEGLTLPEMRSNPLA